MSKQHTSTVIKILHDKKQGRPRLYLHQSQGSGFRRRILRNGSDQAGVINIRMP